MIKLICFPENGSFVREGGKHTLLCIHITFPLSGPLLTDVEAGSAIAIVHSATVNADVLASLCCGDLKPFSKYPGGIEGIMWKISFSYFKEPPH